MRFILCAIEKHLTQQAYDFARDAFNVEHVIPKNAPDDWEGISHDDAKSLLYRLGNMASLDTRLNRDLGNECYSDEREVYWNIRFAVTQKIGNDNAKSTGERIAAHRHWMATQAVAIWRIGQLS